MRRVTLRRTFLIKYGYLERRALFYICVRKLDFAKI